MSSVISLNSLHSQLEVIPSQDTTLYDQDYFPSNPIPPEMVREVFSYFNLETLGIASLVCKKWNVLIQNFKLFEKALYKEIAFGNADWAKCFGKEVVENESFEDEKQSIPLDLLLQDCKRFKSIYPEHNLKDSLMLVRLPKTLHGQLSIDNFKQMLASNGYKAYRYCSPDVLRKLGGLSLDKSRWVLVTKNVLPGSTNCNPVVQQDMVRNLSQKGLADFDIPQTLEAVICIFAQCFSSGRMETHFSNNPWLFTLCKETVADGRYVLVGGMNKEGQLEVKAEGFYNEEPSRGVAVLKRF